MPPLREAVMAIAPASQKIHVTAKLKDDQLGCEQEARISHNMPCPATLVNIPPAARKKNTIKRTEPTTVHHEVNNRKCVLERRLENAASGFVSYRDVSHADMHPSIMENSRRRPNKT